MKKTWKNIIIVSLVITVLEVLAMVIFINPYYKTQKVFDNIEDGQWQRVQTYYEKLNERQKNVVQNNLENYAVHLCQDYIAGELSYSETAMAFDAINAIDESGAISDKYLRMVSYNEYKVTVKALHQAGTGYDNSTVYAMLDQLRMVQQRMKNEDREQALIELLNEEYQSFLDGNLTAEQMLAFTSTVSGQSAGDAYNYAAVIGNNVQCVQLYRNIYTEAEEYYNKEKYFETIQLCRAVVLDESDTLYKGMFDGLYAQAYETGKNYYESLLESYITDGDKKRAIALMDSIEACYGEDFDLTALKERLAEDWQLAYIDCLENVENTLQTELMTFETGQYILDYEYDNLKPDSLVLHDIDGDGVPEMFLYNSAHQDDDYIGCFIFAYVDGKCKFINFVNVKSFCRDSNLIGFPIAFGRTAGDEYSLVQFDGSSLTTVSYCQELGGTYYVNGAESNDVDYLSARTSILAHADAYNVGNSKGVSLDDGETYILAY